MQDVGFTARKRLNEACLGAALLLLLRLQVLLIAPMNAPDSWFNQKFVPAFDPIYLALAVLSVIHLVVFAAQAPNRTPKGSTLNAALLALLIASLFIP